MHGVGWVVPHSFLLLSLIEVKTVCESKDNKDWINGTICKN